MGNFWDDFKDGAEKIAKIAIDKTTTAVDITKLNLAKRDAEGKLNKLYIKVGEKIYKQHKDGAAFDDDIAEVLVNIDKFKAEINEIQEKIAEIKNEPCRDSGVKNTKKGASCAKDSGNDDEEDAIVDIVVEEN